MTLYKNRRILIPTKNKPKEKTFAEELKELHLSLISNEEKKKKVNYKKLYEDLKKEFEKLKSQMENNNQTVSGNSNIQISAGKDVNITISEGDNFRDSVKTEESR
jgi:hypothetical protein|tara:strand:+ start:2076 stop:2390 length:315 start_codon:yes stop_codon:yes gene_type:complete